jgi:predicted enzyme related to lactoylglutathione lyase
MNTHQGGAVIYAKDPKRVAAFYEHVASMRVCRTAEDHVMLESGSFQLIVVRIPERIAKSITIESPPVRRENGAIKPVLFAENIAHAREVAAKYGGALDGAGREWPFDGTTVCDGCDPEGNVFQLRQRQEAER